jgi:hypothetical protein
MPAGESLSRLGTAHFGTKTPRPTLLQPSNGSRVAHRQRHHERVSFATTGLVNDNAALTIKYAGSVCLLSLCQHVVPPISLPQQTLYDLLFSGTRQSSDIDRRVQIRVGGEPTVRIATKELGLRCSVCLLTVPTAAACLARVRRVHIDHWHTSQRRLVGDEGSKLEEGQL